MSIFCSQGAIDELPGILADRQRHHVFLVTGHSSYKSSGAEITLDEYLKPYTVTHFSEIDENPEIEQLELGLTRFREVEGDLIIAVGGGSVMDMAKLIRIFSSQPKPPLAYVKGSDKLSATKLPLVAIPTTAGSGSQATHFAVLYIGKSKYSVAHSSMLPDDVLIDSNLLRSVPAAVAASTGLDALNQGIESYWSIHSTNKSKALARDAIELVWKNLPEIVHRPNEDVYLSMATGAHRAGEAINITKTTAPHAISYPITSFFGVPHGHAVGLVLGSVMVFNASVDQKDCLDRRGPGYVRQTITEIAEILGQADANGAARAYDGLMDEIGLSRNFRALGIETQEHLETIVSRGFNPERVNNNPRLVTASVLYRMLGELQHKL